MTQNLSNDIVQFFNEFLKKDRTCLEQLITQRIPCNHNIIEHPYIQVSIDNKVGLIGIINGILGPIGRKMIAVYDDQDKLIDFRCVSLDGPREIRRYENIILNIDKDFT